MEEKHGTRASSPLALELQHPSSATCDSRIHRPQHHSYQFSGFQSQTQTRDYAAGSPRSKAFGLRLIMAPTFLIPQLGYTSRFVWLHVDRSQLYPFDPHLYRNLSELLLPCQRELEKSFLLWM